MSQRPFEMVYIDLVNFAKIKSGMGLKRLFIDFTKLPNTITLFMGANGTGKTSVMRCLHPFAYNNASGDAGDSNELITPGEDGKKEIVYTRSPNVFKITHLYLRKKDGSLIVKSYFKMDGEELNANGNVSSFKSLVEEYFGLKESYLGLLSIGNTVSSFVKFTSTERKKFAVKLFSILDVYGSFYQNATKQVREIKPVLMNVSAKLTKLTSDTDMDEMNAVQMQKESENASLQEKVNSLYIQIGEIDKDLSIHHDEIDECNKKRDRVQELFNEITTLSNSTFTKDTEEVLQSKIDSVKEEIARCDALKEMTQSTIKSILSSIDEYTIKRNRLDVSMEKIASKTDMKELADARAQIEREISDLNLDGIPRPSQTSDRLILAKVHIDEMRGMCIDILANVINPAMIPIVLGNYKKNHNIGETYLKEYNDLSDTYATYGKAAVVKEFIPRNLLSDIRGVKCDAVSTCPYAIAFKRIHDALTKSTGELDSEMNEMHSKLDIATDKLTIYRNINKVYQYYDQHKKDIELPLQIFNPDTMIDHYLDNRDVCDRGLLSNVISVVEAFERYDNLSNQLQMINMQIDSIESTREAYDSMKTEYDDINGKLRDLNTSLDSQRSTLRTTDVKMIGLTADLRKYQKGLGIVSELNTKRLEMDTLKAELSLKSDLISKIQKMNETKEELNDEIKKSTDRIERNNSWIDHAEHIRASIKELEEEQKTLYKQLSEKQAIQQAVSPTSGIPVVFIRDFIKGDLIVRVNRILNTVYHGKLVLDRLSTVIDGDTFTIPYTWNGIEVADISRASDGQKAILTLAFSIALVQMTSNGYNTLLLDEMDTTLDTPSKSKFITLLEQYAADIQTHMIFLISHNSMFDGHPVNILLTSDMEVANTDTSQIVRLYECDQSEEGE